MKKFVFLFILLILGTGTVMAGSSMQKSKKATKRQQREAVIHELNEQIHYEDESDFMRNQNAFNEMKTHSGELNGSMRQPKTNMDYRTENWSRENREKHGNEQRRVETINAEAFEKSAKDADDAMDKCMDSMKDAQEQAANEAPNGNQETSEATPETAPQTTETAPQNVPEQPLNPSQVAVSPKPGKSVNGQKPSSAKPKYKVPETPLVLLPTPSLKPNAPEKNMVEKVADLYDSSKDYIHIGLDTIGLYVRHPAISISAIGLNSTLYFIEGNKKEAFASGMLLIKPLGKVFKKGKKGIDKVTKTQRDKKSISSLKRNARIKSGVSPRPVKKVNRK